MVKSFEDILKEQLGGLVFMLCAKDAEIEALREQLAAKVKDEKDAPL